MSRAENSGGFQAAMGPSCLADPDTRHMWSLVRTGPRELTSMLARSQTPRDLVLGAGTPEQHDKHARWLQGKRVLLFSDRWMGKAGLAERTKGWMPASDSGTEIYLDVEPEPALAGVEPYLAAAL